MARLRTKVLVTMAALAAVAVVVALLVSPQGCTQHPALPADQRPSEWARPMPETGIQNFHKVSDTLYRGAQPKNKEEMRKLHEMGIKTVINLRQHHDDEDEIGDLPLKRVDIHVNTGDPKQEQVVAFLKAVADKGNHPVYVHCWHGSDRTGLMCAVYRAAVEGWPKEKALAELKEGGYGFHTMWKNIPEFFMRLDIDALKKEAGIK